MKPRILASGPVSMDFVQRTAEIPGIGEVAEGIRYDYVPGGVGSVYALTSRALGADVLLCARVGADSNGQRLRSIYRDADIDVRFTFMDRHAPTGLRSVVISDAGERQSVEFKGANAMLSPVDVEDALTSLPDAMIMSLDMPEKTVISASEYAYRKNIPVVIDGSSAVGDFPLSKLAKCDVFTPDDTELEKITGIKPSTTEECLRSVIRLSSIVKSKYYVIKMGERGAFLYDGKYYNVILANNVAVTDRTSAGDIFTSALTVEYVRSENIMRAASYANAAAALSVSHPGSLDSIPMKDEVEKFIAERRISL